MRTVEQASLLFSYGCSSLVDPDVVVKRNHAFYVVVALLTIIQIVDYFF